MALSNFVLNSKQFDPSSDNWTIFKEKMIHLFKIINVQCQEQVSVLISILSPQAYKLLRDMCTPDKPENKTFEQLCALLDKHYGPIRNIWQERKRFFESTKNCDESISSWYARVMQLAAECQFGNEISVLVKYKFISGISGKQFTTLCELAPDATLEQAVNTAQTMELKAEVEYNQSVKINKVANQNINNKNSKRQFNSERNTNEACWRCGKIGHLAGKCRYKGYKCSKCSIRGHLSAVCSKGNNKNTINKQIKVLNVNLTRGNGSSNSNSRNQNQYEEQKVKQQNSCRHPSIKKSTTDHSDSLSHQTQHVDLDKKFFISNLKVEDSNNLIIISVLLNEKICNFELDSGAAVSVISEDEYKMNYIDMELEKVNTKITTFSGECLNIIGSFVANIKYENKSNYIRIYVIRNANCNVLGRDFLKKFNLGFQNINDIRHNYQQKLEELLHKYSDIFDDKLGRYKYGKISLELKDNVNIIPKFVKARPIPYSKRPLVEKELLKWCEQDLIEKVDNSDWGTPLVVTQKKDGVRLCGDCKTTINPMLKGFNHPLPRIDIFSSFSKGKVFAKLDVRQAFMQFELDEKSQMLCALSTHLGIFKMKRMPYGIKPATGKFQNEIEKVISGINGVVAYVDDLLVLGENEEQLLERLELTFEAFQKAGLKLNREKCKFLTDSIEYLGHTISANGLSKNKSRIETFLNCKEPQNVEEVRAFCGVVNYYSKFVENIAGLLGPIYDCLKENQEFKFDEICKKAFKEIKERIAEDITLAHYNVNAPLILTTDASKHSIAAVLATLEEGHERPIAFISRKLTKAEITSI